MNALVLSDLHAHTNWPFSQVLPTGRPSRFQDLLDVLAQVERYLEHSRGPDRGANGARPMSTPHDTARDVLDAWDRGETIWTVEMGGMGPGYEQCIVIATMEAIRAFVDDPDRLLKAPDETALNDRLNQALWANAVVSALRLSGAQAGAAKNLAYHALKSGWRRTLESAPQDHLVQASKRFP